MSTHQQFEFGNSGDVIQRTSPTIVRKTEAIKGKKLIHQCLKQINFKSTPVFFTPNVLGYGTNDENQFWFDMDFVEGSSPLDFFSTADKSSIVGFTDNIIWFLKQEIEGSEIVEIDQSIFEQKIFSMDVEPSIKERLFDLVRQAKKPLLFPVGKCHGDLTFSNMIFSQGKICLLDFLPCYLESPLQDVVKLRQDTKHLWLLHKTTRSDLDLVKLKIVFEFMDNKLVKVLEHYPWYKDYYCLFQKMNLARILPYTKTNKTLTIFLEEQISIS